MNDSIMSIPGAARAASLALAVSLLGGCASSELRDRLDAVERRQADRDTQAIRSMQELTTTLRRQDEQMRRIEATLSRQMQTAADQERAIRDALVIAQESASVTRRLEIRQLGGTPLIVVRPDPR